MSDDIYTAAQVAQRLMVSEAWLRREASQSRFPSHKIGRNRLFTEADVQQILDATAQERASVLTPGSAAHKRRRP